MKPFTFTKSKEHKIMSQPRAGLNLKYQKILTLPVEKNKWSL